MPTAKEHARIVLGAILPNRLDLLQEALKNLTAEHFVDAIHSRIFLLLDYYFQKANGVLTEGALNDLLERGKYDIGRRALFIETYTDFKALKVDDSEFLWSVDQLRETLAETQMKEALVDGMEIIQTGLEKGGEILKGQDQAREYLINRLADIDVAMSGAETPHGDMREESNIILREYADAKKARSSGEFTGVQFGVDVLDDKVGGIQRGDLVLSAAYSSEGKSALCVQMAWSTTVEHGKNVLFLTTETVNTVVRRRLIARHSRHPRFSDWQLPEGLNSRDLKSGSLNPHEEEFLEEVVRDFTDPKSGYGHMYIHQVPKFSTMDQVEYIMHATQQKFNIDLVICDYLALLRPVGHRNTDRESLSGILKNAKQIATSFNKGHGVPFVSPWQVSRAAKDDADSKGMYTSQALAETSEATNTPDVIVSILAPVDNTSRYADLTAQVLKNRDGETANDLRITVDYATNYFASAGSMSFTEATFSVQNNYNDLDHLL